MRAAIRRFTRRALSQAFETWQFVAAQLGASIHQNAAASSAMRHWMNASMVTAINKWEYVCRRENRTRQINQWGQNHYVQRRFEFWYIQSNAKFRDQLRAEEAALLYVRYHLGGACRTWRKIAAALPRRGPSRTKNDSQSNGRDTSRSHSNGRARGS